MTRSARRSPSGGALPTSETNGRQGSHASLSNSTAKALLSALQGATAQRTVLKDTPLSDEMAGGAREIAGQLELDDSATYQARHYTTDIVRLGSAQPATEPAVIVGHGTAAGSFTSFGTPEALGKVLVEQHALSRGAKVVLQGCFTGKTDGEIGQSFINRLGDYLDHEGVKGSPLTTVAANEGMHFDHEQTGEFTVTGPDHATAGIHSLHTQDLDHLTDKTLPLYRVAFEPMTTVTPEEAKSLVPSALLRPDVDTADGAYTELGKAFQTHGFHAWNHRKQYGKQFVGELQKAASTISSSSNIKVWGPVVSAFAATPPQALPERLRGVRDGLLSAHQAMKDDARSELDDFVAKMSEFRDT